MYDIGLLTHYGSLMGTRQSNSANPQRLGRDQDDSGKFRRDLFFRILTGERHRRLVYCWRQLFSLMDASDAARYRLPNVGLEHSLRTGNNP
jgi:hypothetical protein